jgi:hypothetical protein
MLAMGMGRGVYATVLVARRGERTAAPQRLNSRHQTILARPRSRLVQSITENSPGLAAECPPSLDCHISNVPLLPLGGAEMIFVTGGAGFIGANFVVDWISAKR